MISVSGVQKLPNYKCFYRSRTTESPWKPIRAIIIFLLKWKSRKNQLVICKLPRITVRAVGLPDLLMKNLPNSRSLGDNIQCLKPLPDFPIQPR